MSSAAYDLATGHGVIVADARSEQVDHVAHWVEHGTWPRPAGDHRPHAAMELTPGGLPVFLDVWASSRGPRLAGAGTAQVVAAWLRELVGRELRQAHHALAGRPHDLDVPAHDDEAGGAPRWS